MSALNEITQEKQRLTEELERIDAIRERLSHQLNELEATERVLARYRDRRPSKPAVLVKAATTNTNATTVPRSRKQRRAGTEPKDGGTRSSSKLGEQVLALATGKTQQQIAAACKGARPNHVGAAIARHKRSGRIAERGGKLYARKG